MPYHHTLKSGDRPRYKSTKWIVGFLAAGVLGLGLPSSAQADDPPFVGWSAFLPGLTEGYDPSSENECTAGRVRCVDAVIREMRRRFDPLAAACDHDSIFALSYLRTTEVYRSAIQEPNFFEDTAFVNHEDAVFARYFFEATDDWQAGRRAEVPPAWRVAMEAADQRTMPASGNLSLGINAHVQRDLPFVLAGIGLVKPDGTSRKADHDKVNVFLNRVTDGLIAEIASRFDPTADDGNIPTAVDDVGLFQIIPTWREIAWRNAERLATAPNEPARAAVAADIEAYAASQAEALRRGSAYLPVVQSSAARDAYCSTHH
jgi:hypothetical protein